MLVAIVSAGLLRVVALAALEVFLSFCKESGHFDLSGGMWKSFDCVLGKIVVVVYVEREGSLQQIVVS